MSDAPTWPDGRVRLPDALAQWVDGHCEPGMGDDGEEADRDRNVVAVALWSLIYRQGDNESGQAALDSIASFAARPRVGHGDACSQPIPHDGPCDDARDCQECTDAGRMACVHARPYLA